MDFISGPKRISTLSNLLNGKTDSLIEKCDTQGSWVISSSFKVLPAITRAASFAKGTPVVLLTKGIVRDARGLTSRINISSPLTANWMLIKPITPNSQARLCVCFFMSETISGFMEKVGSEQALSPE